MNSSLSRGTQGEHRVLSGYTLLNRDHGQTIGDAERPKGIQACTVCAHIAHVLHAHDIASVLSRGIAG